MFQGGYEGECRTKFIFVYTLSAGSICCCGMASGKGRYALEAAGAVVWDPEKAIEVTSLERALEVRQHFGYYR